MSLADKYFKDEVNQILTSGFNDEQYEVAMAELKAALAAFKLFISLHLSRSFPFSLFHKTQSNTFLFHLAYLLVLLQ